MLKNLMVLSAFVMLGGCETLNQASQCDPDKNYVISNPEAIDKYKKLLSNNEIKSVFYKNIPTEKCNWDSCVNFDHKKFNFIERYFNDEYRQGVYKVNIAKSSENRTDCLVHDPAAYNLEKICFYLTKNKNDTINSNYIKTKTKIKDVILINLYDEKEKLYLFQSSSQIYSTNAIGSYGAGYCKESENNNRNYEFNVFSIGK